MLVDAASDDVTTVLIQEDEHKQFMDNVGASRGAGPKQVIRAYDDQQSHMACAKELVKFSSTEKLFK